MSEENSAPIEVDMATVDVVIEDFVVIGVTIEIKKDMVRELGSANYWKMLIQKTIESHLPEAKYRTNVQ